MPWLLGPDSEAASSRCADAARCTGMCSLTKHLLHNGAAMGAIQLRLQQSSGVAMHQQAESRPHSLRSMVSGLGTPSMCRSPDGGKLICLHHLHLLQNFAARHLLRSVILVTQRETDLRVL